MDSVDEGSKDDRFDFVCLDLPNKSHPFPEGTEISRASADAMEKSDRVEVGSGDILLSLF